MPRRSLTFMLVAYVLLCSALHLGLFTITDGLMLANQNFIFIYVAVILCYFRLNRDLVSRLVALLAVLSSAFLIAGFRWTLLIPIALAITGYWLDQHRRVRSRRALMRCCAPVTLRSTRFRPRRLFFQANRAFSNFPVDSDQGPLLSIIDSSSRRRGSSVRPSRIP